MQMHAVLSGRDLSAHVQEARRMIASYERIESNLRMEVEAARAEFMGGGPDAAERYRRALSRFNAFVLCREVPGDLSFHPVQNKNGTSLKVLNESDRNDMAVSGARELVSPLD